MNIGLHDAEREHLKNKRFPNYAIMKISSYHLQKGDLTEWWNPERNYDVVYSSKIFDFTPDNKELPSDTIRGGSGYRDIPMDRTLPEEMDRVFPDYTLYPECDYAIGYITRGCPNKCRWCIVPQKEGQIKPYREWKELVRADSKKIVLMDNNILASDYGIRQLESMIDSGYSIDMNQGMDARLMNDEIAKILSRLKWIRFIRFSCDTVAQIEPVEKAIELLGKYGVRPYRIFIYLLVTDNLADAEYRVDRLKRYKGIDLYAQAERNERLGIRPGKGQLEFSQKYIWRKLYEKETWWQYCGRHGFELGWGEEI